MLELETTRLVMLRSVMPNGLLGFSNGNPFKTSVSSRDCTVTVIEKDCSSRTKLKVYFFQITRTCLEVDDHSIKFNVSMHSFSDPL